MKSWSYLKARPLDFLELVMGLEEEFNVTISDDDFKQVKTVSDVTALIQRLLEREQRLRE